MRLGVKLLTIGVVLILLAVPLTMLRGLVHERQARAWEVAADVANSSSREQRLVGPLLLVEIERLVRRRTVVTEGGVMREVVKEAWESDYGVHAPERLIVNDALSVERRYRGLFPATVYLDRSTVRAEFAAPALPAPEGDVVDTRIAGAWLSIGLGDTRGIRSLQLKVAGAELRPEVGTRLDWLPEGVHARLDSRSLEAGRPIVVEAALALAGTQAVSWLPVGADTQVTIRADWPHPGFTGSHLPTRSQIDDDGFSAEWTISRLASRAQQVVAACGRAQPHCPGIDENTFAVRLVDPVDRYLMTERAMKYALLFLALIFGAVFLTEAIKRVAVHPVQYALTGLALGMFFLLLLSLSEHIGFGRAYAIAGAACVALTAVYMSGVLGLVRGAVFALFLAGLYGLLYGILQSEDYALLTGTVALFALLASVMIVTRRFDWYRLGSRQPPPAD